MQRAIVKGLKEQAAEITKELLSTVEALDIIQEQIIPALDKMCIRDSLMAYAVSRSRKIQAIFFSHGLNESVVVGVFKSGLQSIVVYVSH